MISKLVVFIVVLGVFSSLLGQSARRTIGGILSVILGIILFGGFIVSRIIAAGIIWTVIIGVGLFVLICVLAVRSLISRHRSRRDRNAYRCRNNCYNCPQRRYCNKSY